ncbi:MAG: hypothetical protein Q4C37_07215 [Bacteroidales bacterium]|nr:hypothetical protein [Bacteroidales bacterium]
MMTQKFRIAHSNRQTMILTAEFALLALYGFAVFSLNSMLRTGIFAILLIGIMISFISFLKNRYEINDSDIIVDFYGQEKNRYQIDKITKIVYIDTASKWRPFSRQARYQLAIYFERSYLKSIEPRCFFPADRDRFAEAILKINPRVCVEKTDVRYYPFLVG